MAAVDQKYGIVVVQAGNLPGAGLVDRLVRTLSDVGTSVIGSPGVPPEVRERLQEVADLADGAAEPVFLIRAQDALAPLAVRDYATRAWRDGLFQTATAAHAAADAIETWQIANHDRVKNPD